MLLADLPILLVMPILLALSAIFSGSETALFGLTYHDRMRLRRASPRAEALTSRLLTRPRALLVSLLLSNTVINTVYFVLTSALLIRHKDQPALAVSINIINLLLLILFAEILPKVLAGANRVLACRLIAGPISALHAAIAPVRTLIERGIIAPLTRLVRPVGDRSARSNGLSVDELAALVELGGSQGAIDAGEQEVLAQVLELGTQKVRDIMTPRVRMTWIDSQATLARISQIAASTRATRLPVRKRNPVGARSTILGILNLKKFLASAAGVAGAGARPTDFLEPVRYVPETARLDLLLEHFRRTHAPLALCVNEHGTVVGSVTMDDVAQRLVTEAGPLSASGDGAGADGQAVVRPAGPGRWIVPGRLSAREWAELFGQDADRRVTTVAGLVLARLGRMPAVGDVVRIGNVQIQVDSVLGKVVDRVLVSIAVPEDSAGATPGEKA